MGGSINWVSLSEFLRIISNLHFSSLTFLFQLFDFFIANLQLPITLKDYGCVSKLTLCGKPVSL